MVVVLCLIIIALLIVILALVAYASGVVYDLEETKAEVEKIRRDLSLRDKR